jgi:DNA polymerase-4
MQLSYVTYSPKLNIYDENRRWHSLFSKGVLFYLKIIPSNNSLSFRKKMKTQIRKIIHVDMDAFYASVEERDYPEYRGKAIAVGSPRPRGVVSAASYEARKYGVHSAMASLTALNKCPHLIFVRPRFEAYKEASDAIMSIFREYTDKVEPLSLDEAYLDVTQNKFNNPSATLIAREIKEKIKRATRLTASAGISINKFLAKVASDYDKPDGIFLIGPEDAPEFIDKLPIGKIPGIGKVTEQKMHKYDIFTGGDLKAKSRDFMHKHFGKVGIYFHRQVHLEYFSEVTPVRERKSIGAERTFRSDFTDISEMEQALSQIADKVASRMEKKDVAGKTITLKIKYFDFDMNTRSRTLDYPIFARDEIHRHASELLTFPIRPMKPVRLLGIQISNLEPPPESQTGRQLCLNFYS